MIAKIIEYSASNRLIVILLVLFTVIWGYWALKQTPLDAIPDLSDTQVIVYAEWPGRSPDLVEDQITYPISSTLLAAPKVEAVRGFSFFGSSFIYIIFQEGTDIYWARSRVLEYLQGVKNKLPTEVNPVLGPDATSLGWGFSYALVDEKGQYDLAQLRSLQDWNIKFALESVPGVAQVASVGGFVRQYQIIIDPNRLLAYNLPITKVIEAVRKSNLDVEGRVLELSGFEYMVSAFVVIITLPVAIILSFICMYYLKVTSNIMSLSGIAIAIGAMVDASIIMVENAHKKLEEPGTQDSGNIIIEAAKEVGPSLFFSLLVITVGFLPVFTLQGQAGRLFKPLAYTKTFAMLFSSFLAITLTPVLMTIFIRGKIRREERNPISRVLHSLCIACCSLLFGGFILATLLSQL